MSQAPSSQTLLQSLFAQKSWANRALFDCLATAAAEQPETVEKAVRMLNHIYVVDRIFRAHLLGEAHGYTAANTPETPELGELHFAVAETDLWFEGYAASLGAAALQEPIAFAFTDGDAGTMTREEILAHVLAHGSYHRGNVGQMLKDVSVVPPRDLLTKFLHEREPQRRRPAA
ncbi:DinB family protein [Paucibacter sp. R3-3]|uniref:DinB family protein n=1 Tax=Roseateles agri TaxID=3098619 RepID=A0ABU5DFV4_9BURK|nr:DinB family protein [Paucibacter sp. R3-3]MDY0744027.1 DinB family protein [Paucibacter sp. R3-3]